MALVRELPPNKGIGTCATLVQPQALETALPNYSPASLRVVLAKYMALLRFKVASMQDHQRTIQRVCSELSDLSNLQSVLALYEISVPNEFEEVQKAYL